MEASVYQYSIELGWLKCTLLFLLFISPAQTVMMLVEGVVSLGEADWVVGLT